MVPTVVIVRAVAIVLAVGLVVLAVVGDKVAKRETIVGDDEIDALGWRLSAHEQVVRARHPGGDLTAQSRIAPPEAARGVAKAVVPFGERGGKLTEAIAAWANIPRLGDEARFREYGISGERVEERRLRIEARVAAAERCAEIEAKAIDAALDRPALKRADRHIDDQRAVERQAVAGARIVDVELRIAGVETEPRRIVEPAERERRPQLIALAVVVEHDVEDRFHARRVQRVSRRADLLPAAGRKAWIGRAEHDGVVTPCVGQAERREVPLVDECVGGHDLDRGDAERGQMRDRRGMRERREGSTLRLGDRRVKPREAAQVELVDDERLCSDALMSRLASRRRSCDRLRRVAARVLPKRKHRRVEAERPIETPSVRIGQQFGRIKTESPLRIVGALDAEAVARAGAEPRREATQHAVRVARHRRANDLPIAVIDAERRALGVGQHERRFEPARRDDDAPSRLWVVHSAEPARSR